MEAKNQTALGVIETKGLAPLVEAVDASLKAAQVTLAAKHQVGRGLMAATLTGQVGPMRAALAAAAAVLDRLGAESRTHLIPRLAPTVWAKLDDGSGGGASNPVGKEVVVRPEAELPAVRPKAGPPALKPKAGLPAVKPKASAPADKLKAQPPEVKPTPSGLGPSGKPSKRPKAKTTKK